MRLLALTSVVLLLPLFVGCSDPPKPLASRDKTFAELRTVRRGVTVTHAGEAAREPFVKERLTDGAEITLADGGLAWLRRDGGATLLVKGPARLELREDHLVVREGRLFVDAEGTTGAEIAIPRGAATEALHLLDVRASIDVAKDGSCKAYVLRGSVRTEGGVAAGPGETLSLAPDGKAATQPETVWEDWTGGLAVTDPSAQASPYGVGTVAARLPGDTGAPRYPLSIQKLDVRVTIDGDLAVTEVEEVFFNPTSSTVEGLYRFRTPPGATLHRFGVDRDGEIVWGRSKEQAAAAAQYQKNVYQGSKEDPALLEWDAPGVYKARLYPIEPGGRRRVITRYAEWLGRQGAKGERRLYTYPMAAEGAVKSAPRIEELTVRVDLGRSGATDVRSGMDAMRVGSVVTVRQWDTTPRADFSLELFDGGATGAVAHRAKHTAELDTVVPDQRRHTEEEAKKETDYVLVPVRAPKATEPKGGLDLAIVVDTSAATEPSALRLAQRTTDAILSHLGPEDRVVVWAGDAALRPVGQKGDKPAPVTKESREAIVLGLAKVERGGATDLGALLADAASKLDPARRNALVYVGDGRPTVGELSLGDLRTRVDRLPKPLRLLSIGVGHEANMGLLKGLSRGALSERVTDATGAAGAALRLLEEAERPVWLGVAVDLGAGIERVYPRDLGTLAQGETALVVGRVTGALPKEITVRGSGGEVTLPLTQRTIDDDGDEKRRWAEGRLVQLLDEGAGRAAVVEVGTRYGVITPFTSLYVPTKKELVEEKQKLADEEEAQRPKFFRGKAREDREMEEAAKPSADNKEGGTGTRAKGEEGSMGNPNQTATNKRYGVQGPKDNADPHLARQAALADAQEFGMIGLLNTGAGGDGDATSARGNMWGGEIGDSFGAGGLGLSGIGEGGGGRGEGQPKAAAPMSKADGKSAAAPAPAASAASGEGIGLGSIGTLGHGAGTGTGQGFGSGHGRLGGAHKAKPPEVRMGATTVNGQLPSEVIQRIVRQNFGRFRLCYENGLQKNPNLQGRVAVKFVIDRAGAVSTTGDGGSDLPDASVVSCVVNAFSGLSFPQPEGGIVTVVFPVTFAPGDGPVTPLPAAAPTTPLRLGDFVHVARRCSGAADLPLEERVVLWRERLAAVTGNVQGVRRVYTSALSGCEAPGWRERARLLGLLLDALPAVKGQVDLWRTFGADSTAGDLVYRSILARAKTAAQLRDLNDALGLRRMDPGELEKAVAGKGAEDRVKILRGLAEKWPDDHELALKLLDAYEDAGDVGSGRAFARALRALPAATARVRTAVAEYHLRLGKRPGGEGDAEEARRCFGEIVEFAPEDPAARRRLGDLLRSHGWHAEASRQYETLQKLVPDDATVPVLLAQAAEGMGRVEEAIKWTEKASAGSAPDGRSGTGRTARGFAAVFLAWAREAAKAAGRAEEAERLRERAKRLTGGDAAKAGARVFLTWSHPELHPALWSNAQGGFLPARDGDPLLGLAEVVVAPGKELEIRMEPGDAEHAARLGAEAFVTAIFDEGTDKEVIVRLPIAFDKAKPTRKLRVEAGSVKEAP